MAESEAMNDQQIWDAIFEESDQLYSEFLEASAIHDVIATLSRPQATQDTMATRNWNVPMTIQIGV